MISTFLGFCSVQSSVNLPLLDVAVSMHDIHVPLLFQPAFFLPISASRYLKDIACLSSLDQVKHGLHLSVVVCVRRKSTRWSIGYAHNINSYPAPIAPLSVGMAPCLADQVLSWREWHCRNVVVFGGNNMVEEIVA